MSDTYPVLYSFRRCPYAMRARLSLIASGQAVILREVKLADKPTAMLKASPKGTVPVLVLIDGTIIDESFDIMRWALQRNDPQGWLSADQGLCHELIHKNDGDFKHHLDRTKYHSRYDGADPRHHREQAMRFVMELDQRLASSAYLQADHMTLADAAILPFIRQFANIDRDLFNTSPCPHVHAWLDRYLNSDLFRAIMFKYVPWADGDEPLLFGS